ncbi:MAG: hypothetical protein EB141_17365 [Verrucomicrobia bacterium]|nr:hypothetical protein [Verrucomicrobiota bacterium]NBU07815.1 hypothetical protein [Pseudomonadota bacterium]NDA68220.1 hypothetical protein [Verrucomicrobiota bacterium]NDB77382.1 hypothetical protein [Verrucomicrobiota bacterium]NDD40045.1 hypothetical protein [Verrucomicrobiota bacterium]
MPPTKESVVLKIRDAFRGVPLGNGVGLQQGQAKDGGRKGLEERLRDEKLDWTLLRVADLNECSSSLSFFDAEGMRFHLPAFLIAELQGGLDRTSFIFHLTDLSDHSKSQLSMLSAAQKEAVREFLLFRRGDPEHEYDWPEIERALATYWRSEEEDARG